MRLGNWGRSRISELRFLSVIPQGPLADFREEIRDRFVLGARGAIAGSNPGLWTKERMWYDDS